MSRLLITALLLLALMAPALAQDTYSWTMPSAEEQLSLDQTVIPVGKGAIFVPSITGPEFEPPAALVTGEEVISVPIGQRFVLEPGPYVVLLSSGTPTQGVSISVEVREGETSLVPVRWGALRIEVTDDHRIPHRGSYEIIRADSRQPVGTGFGADTLQGELLQTWLLPPGIYRLVRPGRSYRALRDYVTVEIPESGFVRFRLIQDPETEEFLGGGVLLPDEFTSGATRSKRWFRSVVIGVDGSIVTNENVVGAFNQTQYTGASFLDAQVAFNSDPHLFSGLLQVDEGFSQLRPQDGEPQPIVKATDRIRADLLYTFNGRRAAGPYVRASANSKAFSTRVLVTEDTTFRTTLVDGTTEATPVGANETFLLSSAWEPTLLREGVGINARFLQKNRSVNFNWRAGFGMRQNIYDGALVLDDSSGTAATDYKAVDSYYESGIESTLVATVRLPGWVVYSTNLEFFAPFSAPELDNDDWRPSWNWRNTLSLRLTRNLSFSYFLNVDLEPQVIDKAQVQQQALLRASWVIL